MLLTEASKELGKSNSAVYRHIQRGTPLGRIFKKNKYGRWECLKRDLNKFLAVLDV